MQINQIIPKSEEEKEKNNFPKVRKSTGSFFKYEMEPGIRSQSNSSSFAKIPENLRLKSLKNLKNLKEGQKGNSQSI